MKGRTMTAAKYSMVTECGQLLIGMRQIGEFYGIAPNTLHQRMKGRKNRKGQWIGGMSLEQAVKIKTKPRKESKRKTKQEPMSQSTEKQENAKAELLGEGWRRALGIWTE